VIDERGQRTVSRSRDFSAYACSGSQLPNMSTELEFSMYLSYVSLGRIDFVRFALPYQS